MRSGGELREPIRIESPVPVASAFGADRVPRTAEGAPWSVFLRTRASILPISTRELDAARHEIGEAWHRIRIRYRPGILEDFRVVSEQDGRVFSIEGPPVDPEGQRRYLEMRCLERPEWRQTQTG